ncbi:hypothetical protein IKI14_04130 [bacterium]|nr:hypothetical protein [bacterium]
MTALKVDLNHDINQTVRKNITPIHTNVNITFKKFFPAFDFFLAGFTFFCEDKFEDVNPLLDIIHIS